MTTILIMVMTVVLALATAQAEPAAEAAAAAPLVKEAATAAPAYVADPHAHLLEQKKQLREREEKAAENTGYLAATVHPCDERLKTALKAELDLALEENSRGEQYQIACGGDPARSPGVEAEAQQPAQSGRRASCLKGSASSRSKPMS